MSDEPELQYIYNGGNCAVDVIFIHGLTGNPQATWQAEGGKEFWPDWLAEEFPDIAIYSLGYPASLFEKWAEKEMDMFERAGNVLERLAGKGLGKRPIVFVVHSLGGILAKMIVRKACDAEDEDWKAIAASTRLVVFLSTPHMRTSFSHGRR